MRRWSSGDIIPEEVRSDFGLYATFGSAQLATQSSGSEHRFHSNIFRLHGLPKGIISDRGPQFISQFWSTLFARLGTKLHLTTAYHPQSNGLTERLNGVLLETLRIYAAQDPH